MDASPGSLIWNPDTCNNFTATPILPNNTNSERVCGFQTTNTTLMQQCCSSEVRQYSCWSHCATSTQFGDLANCLNRAQGSNNNTSPPYGLFCQGNATGTVQETVKSSAGLPRVRSPGLSTVLLVACVLVAFLITPTTAACTYQEDHHSVRLGGQRAVTPQFSGFLSQGAPVNCTAERTLNNTASPSLAYDDFFSVLSNATGRQFPAKASVELTYEFSCGGLGQNCYATFAPWMWCTNGTATGCGGDLDGPVVVEACGPVFVSDGNSTGTWAAENSESAMIQGVLGVVNTG